MASDTGPRPGTGVRGATAPGTPIRLGGIAHRLGELRPITEVPELDDKPDLLEQLTALGLASFASSAASPFELALPCLEETVAALPCRPGEVGAFIYATNTFPDATKVPLRAEVSRLLARLGLVQALPIGITLAGCANLHSALRIARSLIASGDADHVVIAAVDIFTPPHSRLIPPDLSIASDGAASAFVTSASIAGGYEVIDTRLAFDPAAGAPGLSDESPAYVQATALGVARLVSGLLGAAGLTSSDLQMAIMNNYNTLANMSMARLARLKQHQLFLDNVPRFAHALAADNLINLDDCRRAGRLQPDGNVLLLGTAPNLWGASLVRVRP